MPKEILTCFNCRFCDYGNTGITKQNYVCRLYDIRYDLNPEDVVCNNHSYYFGKVELPRYVYNSEK